LIRNNDLLKDLNNMKSIKSYSKMNSIKKTNFIIVILLVLSMFGCGSDDSPPIDKIAPVVDFESPSTDKNQPTKLTAGGSIVFKGLISDETNLKSISFSELSLTTKTVDHFVADFNRKLSIAKPKASLVSDKKEDTFDFSIETLAGGLPNVYMLSCTVLDHSDNPTTVNLYFELE